MEIERGSSTYSIILKKCIFVQSPLYLRLFLSDFQINRQLNLLTHHLDYVIPVAKNVILNIKT